MGHAGVRGFDQKGVTRTWDSPYAVPWSCGGTCACAANMSSPPGPVQNIKYLELEHSDYFIGQAHARNFWLPELWGYPPKLYREFRELCIQCRQDEIDKKWIALSREEMRLRTTC